MIANPFVGIAGNIGVGKTTFTEIVGKHFGWKEFYESVADNPYLDDFIETCTAGVLISRFTFCTIDLQVRLKLIVLQVV